ncbi:MAG: V-type ATP synthase subunit F [Eubacterium sp.]|nr:V-type ATP synthase subunit F [Eubacterium sp.]
MRKVAVMGDYDSIYGFSALGLDIYPVKEKDEAKATLKKLVLGDYAIIYVTESVAKEISEEIDKHKESISPAIILIPGISGNTGEGVAQVKSFVEQAVGSDILFGDE